MEERKLLKTSGFTMLVIVLLVVILAAAGVIFYLSGQNNAKVMTSASPVVSISPSVKNVSITLPVIVLPTSYGAGPANQTYNYVKTVNITVPQEFSDQIGAYGIAQEVIIGPKGWNGQGIVGADGSGGPILFPKGGSTDSGSNIKVNQSSACTGCAYDLASPYFPEVAQLNTQLFGGNSSVVPTPPPGIVIKSITPSLVEYSLPNTADGLEVNGLTYFIKDTGDFSGTPQPYSINMEIKLPPSQHNLALELLSIYIQQNNLSK